ncbi:hypothetical protein BSL78_08282, partial [Apostichopus japonicus]
CDCPPDADPAKRLPGLRHLCHHLLLSAFWHRWNHQSYGGSQSLHLGDYQGAEDSSRSAKNWSCAGLVTGLILFGSFFFFYVDSVRGDTGGSSRLLLQLLLATVV